MWANGPTRTVELHPIDAEPRGKTMFEKARRRAAVTLAIAAGAAVAAPSAGAREADFTPTPAVAASHAPPQATTRIVEVRSGGFDWADAGPGAAGMLSLLGVGAAAVAVTRRSRPAVT
jgi:hypothetical protein